MTTVAEQNPLLHEELRCLDAYWRAANYLSVGQIYLLDTADFQSALRAIGRITSGPINNRSAGYQPAPSSIGFPVASETPSGFIATLGPNRYPALREAAVQQPREIVYVGLGDIHRR